MSYFILSRDEQMHVIGHQDIGMEFGVIFVQGFPKIVQVTMVVFDGIKTEFPIIAALDDMLRYAGNRKARFTWHEVISLSQSH